MNDDKVIEYERTFVSSTGFEFRVTITKVYDPLASVDAVVTFWDVKTNNMAATYYLKSILGRRRSEWGFSLHTEVPEWTIDNETMQKVDTFLLAPNSEAVEPEPVVEVSPECDHRDERGFAYGIEIIEKGQRIGYHYDYCPKCGTKIPNQPEES